MESRDEVADHRTKGWPVLVQRCMQFPHSEGSDDDVDPEQHLMLCANDDDVLAAAPHVRLDVVDDAEGVAADAGDDDVAVVH